MTKQSLITTQVVDSADCSPTKKEKNKMATLSYEDAIYPAQITRPMTEDETVAFMAHCLITPGWDVPFPAPPTPNKSARVYSRQKSGMSQHITIEASQRFFNEIRAWLRENWEHRRAEQEAHERKLEHIPAEGE